MLMTSLEEILKQLENVPNTVDSKEKDHRKPISGAHNHDSI